MKLKDFRMMAYHLENRQMHRVTGISGTGNDAKVYTAITSFPAHSCELLLFTGQLDKHETEIFDGWIVSYPVKIGKAEELVIAVVEMENGAFKLFYEKFVGPKEVKRFSVMDWIGDKARILGNRFEHPQLLQVSPYKEGKDGVQAKDL